MSDGPNRSFGIAALRRRGLAGPLALLAEMHRPLRPLLSDLATFATPLLAPLIGRAGAEQLGSEDGMEALLGELASEAADRPDDDVRA